MPRRRARFGTISLLLLSQCVSAPRSPAIGNPEQAIAHVFETAQPYSSHTIDSAALAGFFARQPDSRRDSAAITDFYRRRGMQFAWFLHDSLSASAEAFIDLASAGDSVAPGGATPNSAMVALHDAAHAEEARQPRCDRCIADLELRLTAAFFRLADRQYNGYFGRDLRDLDWFIPRAKKNLTGLLDSLAAGTMDLAAYEPIHPQYRLLKGAIAAYQALAGEPWPALALPARTRTLAMGDSAPVIAAIRDRLHRLGDLADTTGGARYDSTMIAAVLRFQQRHGLAADGVIGPNLLREMNVSPAARMRTMLINIERLRWAPVAQPPDLIVVNIPDFRLTVLAGDSVVMQMKVVVGAAATHTVIFSDSLSEIVFSPSWTVPESIVRNEILPAIRRNPRYLAENHMTVVGGSAQLPVIRQAPGPWNALGLIKFNFPNSFSIYMHDTPAKALFGADRRALSHGCIRVSDPVGLARYLLRDDTAWTLERLTAAMHGGTELFVPLVHRTPVLITYFTAWVDRDGRVNFRDDVYGHDARLGEELFGTGAPGTTP